MSFNALSVSALGQAGDANNADDAVSFNALSVSALGQAGDANNADDAVSFGQNHHCRKQFVACRLLIK